MRLKLTAVEIANEVRMHQLDPGCFIILVEGDADEKLFRNVFNFRGHHMIISFGYENIIEAMNILDSGGWAGALGIIDRDYHGILRQMPASPNIVVTDCRDLEIMLFESDAFVKVLDEFASVGKMAAVLGGVGAIRGIIYNSSLPMACMRLHSACGGDNICFKNVDHSRYLDKKTLAVDERKLVSHLRGSDARNGGIGDDILNVAKANYAGNHAAVAPNMLCRGHDVVSIAAIGMRSLWGTHPAKDITAERLESILRLSVDVRGFRNTALARAVIAWFGARGVAV